MDSLKKLLITKIIQNTLSPVILLIPSKSKKNYKSACNFMGLKIYKIHSGIHLTSIGPILVAKLCRTFSLVDIANP